ncbi:ATPase AAA+ type core [Pleurostoma richardsiae]|uniref:ATPase AAA+ type core n=1 Tax=Pleurostoma richardsiae TaxID=41990 RepID=A0AA38RJE8_9PEZI|nr:ATPase AAA+ type core [Pleurostoma richardsiae]
MESVNGTTATLEKRYIELLEQKIAQLEARLKDAGDNDDKSSSGPKDKDGKDKEEPPTTTSAENSGNEPGSLIHIVVSKFDHGSSQRRDFDSGKLLEPSSQATVQHPVIFRRYMDPENSKRLEYEELVVAFDGLKELLNETLKHHTERQFNAELVNFRSPFRTFVWQWDQLTQACEPCVTDTDKRELARRYLKEVMALISASEGLDSYFKSFASNHAGGTITFDFLWTVYPPGAKVIARSFMDEVQIFEVQSCNKIRTTSNKFAFLLVIAGFDWDGVDFNRAGYCLAIQEFQGPMPIRNLPCVPVSYYYSENDPKGEKLNSDLLKRGRKFVELCTSKTIHHRYQGQVLYHVRGNKTEYGLDEPRQPFQGPITKNGQLRRSEIIVDNASFMRSSRCPASGSLPLGSYELRWFHNLHKFETKQMQYEAFKASDELLLLCSPKVLGYSLKVGRWAQFSIQNVQPIAASTTADLGEAFDKKLKMEPGCKKLIKALVKTHQSNVDLPEKSDIVEGKGKGLVILLHGPPGVGKTLTAETVALATRKPLMPVSTAEIGLEPDEAERNLADIFEDAGRWQAVLLMDEADVFLEERRGTRDLQRNALVGVLLRVLEYYEGIIILTTNRITSLDVAVESRIHLAIRYRDLALTDRVRLFQNFLDDIVKEENMEPREDMDDKIKKMVRRSRINGRQIRNIVTSANLLAKSQNKKLKFAHIEEVHEITEQFLDGLKELTQQKRLANEGPKHDSD